MNILCLTCWSTFFTFVSSLYGQLVLFFCVIFQPYTHQQGHTPAPVAGTDRALHSYTHTHTHTHTLSNSFCMHFIAGKAVDHWCKCLRIEVFFFYLLSSSDLIIYTKYFTDSRCATKKDLTEICMLDADIYSE